MYTISIIIPAHNAEKTINLTIEAIAKQKKLHNKPELIIVDDGSSDKTLEILRQYPEVKIITQNNSGPAAARNKGASFANGDILVFTDSDTIPHENWLSKLTHPFSFPNIQATTGTYSIANKESKLAQLIQAEITTKHSLYGDFVLFGGSYNLAIRKELFNKIGGFNEEYKNASGEDTELCYKILSTGNKIKYVPTAIVGHFHPENVIKYLKTQYIHGFWRAKIYYSFPKQISGDSYTGSKEIYETCFTSIIISSALIYFLSFFTKSNIKYIKKFIIAIIMLLGSALITIENFAYIKISKNPPKYNIPSKIFSISVLSARAFIRTIGFIVGAIKFFHIKSGS